METTSLLSLLIQQQIKILQISMRFFHVLQSFILVTKSHSIETKQSLNLLNM